MGSHGPIFSETRLTISSAPLFPAVKYELKKYDLAPVTKSPFVGFGPEVDEAWDYIANDSMYSLMLGFRGVC